LAAWLGKDESDRNRPIQIKPLTIKNRPAPRNPVLLMPVSGELPLPDQLDSAGRRSLASDLACADADDRHYLRRG
jgi:hypothetical protein